MNGREWLRVISIEAILGGEGNNVIEGDLTGNTFMTLGGDDTLQGRGGTTR